METTIRTEGLTIRFGPTTAIEDVDLELPAGAVIAVVGPNGAGKTTLLHALSGLLRPAAGTVRVLGRPPAEVRPAIAYVLQRTTINEAVPLSVREVVRMARYVHRGPFRPLRAADHRAVEQAMRRMGIVELADRHLSELSGGERQRAFLAQGLAQEAPVLLLDEPATGLDLVSRARVQAALLAERDRGRTVVLSTHDLADAAGCDLVLLLAGRVVALGPPDEVLTAELLATAYGGLVRRLGDRAVVLDDPHHHLHRRPRARPAPRRPRR